MQDRTLAREDREALACLGRFAHGGPESGKDRGEVDGVLCLNAIRLPFPMEVVARRGCHRLAGSRPEGVLVQGESIAVACYRTVRYGGPADIDPHVGYELHLRIRAEIAAPAFDPSTDSGLSAHLARAVFLHPSRDWSVDAAAACMHMRAERLKMRLFRESNACSAIVREQRAIRALLALLADGRAREQLAQTARLCGFADAARMNAAFIAQFGMSASRVAALAWYPAITWSFVTAHARAGGWEAEGTRFGLPAG